MNLSSFEEVYLCSQMHINRYEELLQDAENGSEDVCAILEDAIDAHKQSLDLLQKMFAENFPNIKIMMSEKMSYSCFSSYWDFLVKYPELCQGIEWKVFTAFFVISRDIGHNSSLSYFRKKVGEISSLFATPIMVSYIFNRVNVSSSLVLPFMRWLSSELFSAEVTENIKKFQKAISDYAKDKVLSEQQQLLLEYFH